MWSLNCRRSGCVVLLATQLLSLLLGTLQNENFGVALVANCHLKIFGKNGNRLTNALAADAWPWANRAVPAFSNLERARWM